MPRTFSFVVLVVSVQSLVFGGEEMLSVEETVRVAQVDLAGPVGDDTLVQLTRERLRGNPAARATLHKLLSDKSSDRSVPYGTIVRFFAYIGADDDIAPLTKIYDGEIKDQRDRQLVLGSFYALAGMAARGVSGAKEKLDEISHWSFWNERKIRFGPDSPQGLTAVNDVLSLVLADRSQAFEGDYQRIVESAIAEIPDQAQRRLMKVQLKPRLSTQEARMKSPIRVLFLQKEEKSAPAGAIVPKDAPAGSVLAKTTPVAAPAKAVQDDMSRLIEQALTAYDQISSAFADGSYEKAVPWLARDEEPRIPIEMPLNDENVKKYVEIFRRRAKPADCDVIANMVKEWKAMGGELGPAEVEVVSRSKFVERRRGAGEYGPIAQRSTTIVRIPCPGSETIGQKYFTAPLSPRCRSMTQNKGLVILMIKINDTWYWEPFGG